MQKGSIGRGARQERLLSKKVIPKTHYIQKLYKSGLFWKTVSLVSLMLMQSLLSGKKYTGQHLSSTVLLQS